MPILLYACCCGSCATLPQVFLFNFFEDSPADERTWRVITGIWEREHAADRDNAPAIVSDKDDDQERDLTLAAPRAENFDRQRHSLLNEELKMLYTAVTRARVKVVIYDVSEERRRPMFHFFLAKGLAKIFDSKQTTRGLAAASTPQEWIRQARNLMRQQLFNVAALCFQKGHDEAGMLEALGMHFYHSSTTAADGRPIDRLLRAARCFELAGHTQHAASCLKRANEFNLAAAAYRKLERPGLVAKVLASAAERAANITDRVRLLAESANAWEAAGQLTKAMLVRLSHRELQAGGLEMLNKNFAERDKLRAVALPHLEQRKLYDAAIAVCIQLGLDEKVDQLAQTSAFHHLRRGDKAAMFVAVQQFKSPEMQIAFLRRHGERAMVIKLMKAHGQEEEAYDELLMSGSGADASAGGSSGSVGTGAGPASSASLGVLATDASLPAGVAWLARTFSLASELRASARDGTNAQSSPRLTTRVSNFLDSVAALQSTKGRGGGGSGSEWLHVDLPLCMVLDAWEEAGVRGGYTVDPRWNQMQWTRLMLASIRRLLAKSRQELRECIDAFLRLRSGGAMPQVRMPSWRWVCAKASHDPRRPLVSGSERLRSLVEYAFMSSARRALEMLPSLGKRVRATLFATERTRITERGTSSSVGNGKGGPMKPRQPICSDYDLSDEYLRSLVEEVLSVLDAKAAYSVARAPGRRGTREQPLDVTGISYIFDQSAVLRLAGRVVTALIPEAERDRTVSDLSNSLPHALHPVARIRLLREMNQMHESSSLANTAAEWLSAVLGRKPPKPHRALSLAQLLQDLEHTGAAWRVLTQVSLQPSTFKSKVENMVERAHKQRLAPMLPKFLVFDLKSGSKSSSGSQVHVAMLLRLVHLYEADGDLQQACKPAVDYLEASVSACSDGYAACVSYFTCAELVERVCCYSLAMLTEFSGVELWIPHSHAEALLVSRKAPKTINTSNAFKITSRLLSRGVEAAVRLMQGVMNMAAGGANQDPRFGFVAVERLAICILIILANRMRHAQAMAGRSEEGGGKQGKRGGGNQDRSILSADEATQLLIAPLMVLTQQLRALPHSKAQERLWDFAKAVEGCLAQQQQPSAFCQGLQSLLATRNDWLCGARWPRAWARDRAPYYSLFPQDATAAPGALVSACAAVRDQLSSEQGCAPAKLEAKAVQQAFACEVGWTGLSAKKVAAALQAANETIPPAGDIGVVRRPASKAVAPRILVLQPFESEPALQAALDTDCRLIAGMAACEALQTLDSLWSDARFSRMNEFRARPWLRRLKKFASRAEGRACCIVYVAHLAAAGESALAAHGNGMRWLLWQLNELRRGASEAECATMDAVMMAVPALASHLLDKDGGDQSAAARPSTESSRAGDRQVVEGGAREEAKPTDDAVALAAIPPRSQTESSVPPPTALDAGADDEHEHGEMHGEEDEEEDDDDDAYLSANEEADDEAAELTYAGLGELEAQERLEQMDAKEAASRNAKEAIRESKAGRIQRAWRLRRQSMNTDGHTDDEGVAMYRERLARFASSKAMQRAGHCLLCGVEWGEGHVGSAHWSKQQQFHKYHHIVYNLAAPMLARLDAVRMLLEQQSDDPVTLGGERDEKAETARFTAAHETERCYTDLNAMLDEIEANQAWERTDKVRSAVEFAEAAVKAVEEAWWRKDLVGSGRTAGGEDAEATIRDLEERGERLEGAVAEEEEEEDDELDHLSQMVAAQSRRSGRKGGGSAGAGGSGGPRPKGASGGGGGGARGGAQGRRNAGGAKRGGKANRGV